MKIWILTLSLMVSQFLVACASSKPKTVDEVYEKYGSKAVYERPYSDEEIRLQEQARHQKEQENLQKALEKEQEKNRVLESQSVKATPKEEKTINRQPAVFNPPVDEVPKMIKQDQEIAPIKVEASPASQDLNFSNPLGQ